MFREWRICENEGKGKSLIERLLFSRGIKKEEDIYEFLHPLETKISKPEVFTDMPKVVERLSKAIDNKEKIIIYGDFDADGVTSTSLLYKTFEYLGANVGFYIPDRDKDNHGFNSTAIVNLMKEEKPKLIISVDCGISNVNEVCFIKSFGIDVIITDHHEAPEVMPDAIGIINPKAPNALSENLSAKEIESLTSLAGVGVAFKVATALLNHYGKVEFVYDILPLVAVGTVADIVPLIGENRYLVTKGLELISKGRNKGLKMLLDSSGYKPEKGITSENIAFGIAPRINASGRLDKVDHAVKVLISDNPSEIQISINMLNNYNKVRQELVQRVFEEADEMYQKEGANSSAIVLANPDWHVGIVGIVASKFVEKYYKPAFIMTYSEEKREYRCSARGIDGLSLYEIISSISEMLAGFGGHTLAAGFSFNEEMSSFNDVKKALDRTVKEMLNGKELKPFLNIDMEVKPEDVTLDLVDEISQLEPFGASNPSPVFVMKDLKIKQKRLLGDNKDHLRLTVQAGACEFTCMRWAQGDIALVEGDVMDLAFHPQKNEYKGNVTVQLIVDDIHSEYIKEEEQKDSALKIYDHRKKTDILPLVSDYIRSSKQNIRIFAESKTVCDYLEPYKDLSSRKFNRLNIPLCDSVMFFDYPADNETFDKIIEEAKPSSIHLMKYSIKYYEDKEFLATFVKMLRYAFNNSGGKVDLLRISSALGKSYETILTLLDLLEETRYISVAERNEEFYKIEFGEITDLSSVLNNEKYAEVKALIDECEAFQKHLLEDDTATFGLV